MLFTYNFSFKSGWKHIYSFSLIVKFWIWPGARLTTAVWGTKDKKEHSASRRLAFEETWETFSQHVWASDPDSDEKSDVHQNQRRADKSECWVLFFVSLLAFNWPWLTQLMLTPWFHWACHVCIMVLIHLTHNCAPHREHFRSFPEFRRRRFGPLSLIFVFRPWINRLCS